LSKKRILIVDDSVDAIRYVMGMLSGEYIFSVAKSGQKAIESAINDPQPELILMDVEMPEMNGFEACRQIKQNAASADIPVVFASSHDSDSERQKAQQAGGSGFLSKPLEGDEIRQIINQLIS